MAFWYGGVLITDPEKDYTIGKVMTVFFGVLTGAFSLSAVGQNIEFFASARAAAHSVFEIVDREPTIDIMSTSGEKPKKITGNVTLKERVVSEINLSSDTVTWECKSIDNSLKEHRFHISSAFGPTSFEKSIF